MGGVDQRSIDTPQKSNEKALDARRNSSEDKPGDDYASAKQRCDSLSGNAKDQCVSDAKSRYGVL